MTSSPPHQQVELTLDRARAVPGAGQFLALDDGFTHFELSGPETGPPVVLICGLSSPSFIWDALVPFLVHAGYRVLRYDFYGRGLSARLSGNYGLPCYLEQFEQLIAGTLGNEPLSLLGYSWGAGLCAAYASQNPSRVRQVILQAPGGLGLGQTLALSAIGTPGLGRLLLGRQAQALLLKDLSKCFNTPLEYPDFFERFEAQFSWSGFETAFMNTARDFRADLRPLYRGLSNRPVQVIWGDQDKKVPISQFAALKRCTPQAALHTVPGGAHLMQVETSSAFNHLLLQILGAPEPCPDSPDSSSKRA